MNPATLEPLAIVGFDILNPTSTMSETPAAPSQSNSHRGRGGRRSRPRRGHQNGPGRSNAAAEGVETPQRESLVDNSALVVATVGETGDAAQQQSGQSGRGRGDRGRPAGGRRGRGGPAQRSIVVSHRGGRRPPAPGRGGASPAVPALRAAAPEFVPGQSAPVFGSVFSYSPQVT